MIGFLALACCGPLMLYAQEETDTTATVEELQKEYGDNDYQQNDDKDIRLVTANDEGDGDRKEYFLRRSAVQDSFTVSTRAIPANRVKDMKEDEDFWYADKEPGQPKMKKPQKERELRNYTPITQQDWFQTLLWILAVGGFVAALVMYLGGANVGLFRRKREAIASDAEREEMPEDIFAINYQREIDKAAAQGNYRLAVRLMFLRLLKNMSDRNIIQYKQDRTNLDYLMQLHSTTYYSNFFKVTRNYEYAWYGQFAITEDAYKLIRNDFDHIEQELR